MASVGPLYPSSGSNDASNSGTVSWSSIGNAYAVDGVYARAAGAGAVPEFSSVKIVKGGTITGTEQVSGTIYWNPGTQTFGSSTSLWGETWSYKDINDPNFGIALAAAFPGGGTTYSQYLKLGGFGFNLPRSVINGIYVEAIIYSESPGGGTEYAEIDAVRITVYYTVAPSIGGPNYPTAAADGGGGVAWTNPTNIEAPDGNVASASNFVISGSGAATNMLKATGFNFSIPSTAIIDGIELQVLRDGTLAVDNTIKLLKAGTATGSNKGSAGASVPTSMAWATYGSDTDLWGAAWTPSDINNTNFGVELAFNASHDPGDAHINVDAVNITISWHSGPADVPKRYIYKVYNRLGKYLGNLPLLKDDYAHSLDINTAGTTVQVAVAISPDVASLPTSNYIDESSDQYTTEDELVLITEGAVPLMSLGTGEQSLIQNGNKVRVWEYGYWNPNGKCMFLGEIDRWEASYGGGGNGSGGAATSETTGESIAVTLYSDGQDFNNAIVRGSPYTYTQDQSQGASNQFLQVWQESDRLDSYNNYGQTWKVGSGFTNLGAIDLAFYGEADVTLNVYTDATATTLLGSVTQHVAAPSEAVVQLSFANNIVTVPGDTYFFTVSVGVGQSIYIAYQNTAVYGNGTVYNSYFTGTSGGSWNSFTGDLYFATFSGTGSTTGTYTDEDPSTGILEAIMDDYIARGGIIGYNDDTIDATGLSVSYEFNTNTTYEGIQAMQTIAPSNFYFFVDLGTNLLYFKEVSSTPDIILTKGKHFDQITIIATIENMINQAFFTGGTPDGDTDSIYSFFSDAQSMGLFGPRMERLSDTGVLDDPTALVVAENDVAEKKDEAFQTTVTIVDKTMDITRFKPGQLIGFNGFGSFVDGLTATIVRIDYKPEEVTLTLGTLPMRLNPTFQEVTRSLIGLETLNNPATPSS